MKVPGIPLAERNSSSATASVVGRAVTPTGARIIFPCPLCKSRLLARPDQVGQSILCEECLETVVIPEMSAANRADSTLQQTTSTEPSEPAPAPVKVPEPEGQEGPQQPKQTDSGTMETVHPESFAIVCAVCGTRLYTHQSQIGSRIPCPDCYATTKVRAPKPVKRRRKPAKKPPTATQAPAKPQKTPAEFAIEKAQQELQEQTEVIQTRLAKSRFENLYHFLLLPDIVLRLIVFSFLMTITLGLPALANQMTGGLKLFAMMVLNTASLLIGVVTLLVAMPTAIVIIIETGNGNYEVDDLPGTNFMEAFGHSLYMIICLLAILIPYTVLSHVLSPLAGSSTPLIVTLVCAAALPVLLLSTLETNSPFMIWSPVIYESILEDTSCWLTLWRTTALLFVGQYLLEQLVLKDLPIPPVRLIIHSLLSVAVGLVYFRAIGLLAWDTSKSSGQQAA
ncbi:MAG TPA: hypothetical protein EYN70_07825 [Planctomycetaceae bacterium]|nr:hypothetical protein [Planctomycetaceae bacterium]